MLRCIIIKLLLIVNSIFLKILPLIHFQDTYNRIKKNEYHIPSRVGPLANSLIVRLLQVSKARLPKSYFSAVVE